MSARARSWAWVQIEQGGLTPASALVLLKLADRADPHSGECWPSAATTAGDCGLGQRTVERCLVQLRAAGLIEVLPRFDARGFRLANVFRLPVGRLEEGRQPLGEPPPAPTPQPAEIAAARAQLRRLRDEIASGGKMPTA